MTAMIQNLQRFIASLFIALSLFVVMPQTGLGQDFSRETPSRTEILDRLFQQLRTAPNAGAANEIATRIWGVWLEPEDDDLAVLMARAAVAERQHELDEAVRILDRVVESYPDYAEGWNRRATLFYTLGRYEDSLADIAETLKREPRHFGALSGRAMIYLLLGEEEQAFENIVEALQHHPFLAERTLFPQLVPPVIRL